MPLKGGPWRATSMALLAKAVGLQSRFRLSLPLEWARSLGRRARVNEVEGGDGVDILHSRGGHAIVRSARPREASADPMNPRHVQGESVRINRAARSDIDGHSRKVSRSGTDFDAHERL